MSPRVCAVLPASPYTESLAVEAGEVRQKRRCAIRTGANGTEQYPQRSGYSTIGQGRGQPNWKRRVQGQRLAHVVGEGDGGHSSGCGGAIAEALRKLLLLGYGSPLLCWPKGRITICFPVLGSVISLNEYLVRRVEW